VLRTADTVASGSVTIVGRKIKCDVIKIGGYLRVINKKTNRSIDRKGYAELKEVREAYPESALR